MNVNNLTALIGSRICHDLISPIGAIGNGVELLALSGMATSPEMALIAESVENANARIRYFRIAFGAAPKGSRVGQAEIVSIMSDMFKGGRTTVDWRAEGPQERSEVKLSFLLVLCLENTLPRGGHISVVKKGDQWLLEARGEQVRDDPDLWALISVPNADPEVAASDVHFALVATAAADAEKSIATFVSTDQATVSF